MIYCLTGNSELFKSLFLSELAATRTVSVEDAEKSDKLKSYLSVNSMFGDNSPIVLKEFQKWKKDEREAAVEIIKSWISYNDFIVEGELPKGLPVKEVHHDTPKPWEDTKWIQYIIKIAKKFGVSVDQKAASSLAIETGKNELMIYHELMKLKNLDRIISKEDVVKYCFAVSGTLDEFINRILRREHTGLIEEFSRPDGFPLPLVISAISRALLEVGIVAETTEKSDSFAWKEIDFTTRSISANYPEMKKLGSQKVARICGYSFSKESVKDKNFLKLYSRKRIVRILQQLQEIDEKSKFGLISNQGAFVEILDIFRS